MVKFLRYFSAIILIVQFSCAKPGSPTGGPVDEEAPVIISSKPENGRLNFKSNKIEIKFNELIKFKDLKKQLIVSPPMKNELIIRPTGGASENIRITIQDTLKTNTTYTINFGNSIIDNNEGNEFPNFRYVFSTGDFIDSLTLSGKIRDSYDRKFPENVLVMLYRVDSAYTDSVVFKGLPTYVTSSLDTNTFFIENAKEGKYKLIALLEKTQNLKYNPGQDKIAFYPELISLPDSNKYELSVFMEEAEFGLKRPIHKARGHVQFEFGRSSTDLKIERIFPSRSDSLIDLFDHSKYSDTVNYWFNHKESDSLIFAVSSPANAFADTVTVKLKNQKTKSPSFDIVNKANLNPENRLLISSDSPILEMHKDSVSVLNLADSTYVNFDLKKLGNNKAQIDFQPVYDGKYFVEIMPGAVINIFGETNDTIAFRANVKAKSEFSEIALQLQGNVKYPVIVELTKSDKDLTSASVYVNGENDKIVFSNLLPGKYGLRLIFDENSNKKWDSGNFLQGKQPEQIKYFDEVIDLKATWEVQQTWILK